MQRRDDFGFCFSRSELAPAAQLFLMGALAIGTLLELALAIWGI